MDSKKLEVLGLRKAKNGFVLDIFSKNNKIDNFYEILDQSNLFNKSNVQNKPHRKLESRKKLEPDKKSESDKKLENNKMKFSAGAKMNTNGRLCPYLQFSLPNILGCGDTFKLLYTTMKSLEFNFALPIRTKRSNSTFLEMNASSPLRDLLDKKLNTKLFSLDYKSNSNIFSFVYEILEKTTNFLYFNFKNDENSRLNYEIKTGFVQQAFFSKIDLILRKTILLPLDIFYKIKFRLGSIYGTPHQIDRYFLGENVRGYPSMSISPLDSNERIGGLSCVEISHGFGVQKNIFKFFAFADFGFSSRQSNILETMSSAFKSAFLVLKPSSLGISTGFGMSLNLRKTETHSIDLTGSYGFTFSQISENKPFHLGIDIDVY